MSYWTDDGIDDDMLGAAAVSKTGETYSIMRLTIDGIERYGLWIGETEIGDYASMAEAKEACEEREDGIPA